MSKNTLAVVRTSRKRASCCLILVVAIDEGVAVTSSSINKIKNIDLFEGCGRSKLKQIDGLGTTVELPAGRIVCLQGDPGAEFFVLLNGVVDVRKPRARIARVRAGGWFGETALIHNVARQASIMTTTRSTVIVFDRREFSSLCDTATSIRQRLELTADLFLCGEEPLGEAWYEPAGRRGDGSEPVPHDRRRPAHATARQSHAADHSRAAIRAPHLTPRNERVWRVGVGRCRTAMSTDARIGYNNAPSPRRASDAFRSTLPYPRDAASACARSSKVRAFSRSPCRSRARYMRPHIKSFRAQKYGASI